MPRHQYKNAVNNSQGNISLPEHNNPATDEYK